MSQSRRAESRNRPTTVAFVVTAAAVALAAAACSPGGEGDAARSPAAERGRDVYMNVCIACHHADPTRDGSLGPAIADASRELLEAKVLHATYPPGYTPKRQTNAMPAYPHVAEHLDDLEAFLASSRR